MDTVTTFYTGKFCFYFPKELDLIAYVGNRMHMHSKGVLYVHFHSHTVVP